MDKPNLIGISGSLRKNSFNTSLLKESKKMSQDLFDFKILDIHNLPLYNEDLWENTPREVSDLKNSIKESDIILLAISEYNYSFSGVLKNTIDWASRNPNILDNKVVGIYGASSGLMGTSRAQAAIRPVLQALNTYVMAKPEIFINLAESKFDKNGEIIDEDTNAKLRIFLESLYNFYYKINPI